MKNEVFKIGRFTVSRSGNTVTMKPGFLKIKSTSGAWLYNKECTVNSLDSGAAKFEFKRFCKIARQEYCIDLWERLNHVSQSTYIRFQRLFARHHSGLWVRGINISNGNVCLNLE